jgi:hypothetical protein
MLQVYNKTISQSELFRLSPIFTDPSITPTLQITPLESLGSIIFLHYSLLNIRHYFIYEIFPDLEDEFVMDLHQRNASFSYPLLDDPIIDLLHGNFYNIGVGSLGMAR